MTGDLVGGRTGQGVFTLVPQGDVAPTLPAELGATPAGQAVLLQLPPRQLQIAEVTNLQTLYTLIRLGDRGEP